MRAPTHASPWRTRSHSHTTLPRPTPTPHFYAASFLLSECVTRDRFNLITSYQKSPSPFLVLPAEIRDQIYHNVLDFPDLKPAFEEMRKRDKKTKGYWFSNDVLR